MTRDQKRDRFRFTIHGSRFTVLLFALALLVAAGGVDAGLAPGDHQFSLTHQALARSYVVHMPPQAAAGKPLPVVHWKLTGAGHVWPGGRQDYLPWLLGAGTTVIDANVEMWRFFERFRRPPAQ